MGRAVGAEPGRSAQARFGRRTAAAARAGSRAPVQRVPPPRRRQRHPSDGYRRVPACLSAAGLNPTMTHSHLNIVIRPLARDEALAVAAWRYGGELAMYDGDPGQEEDLLVMTAEGYGYYAIVEDDDFVGYCCFGPEGRVPGQPAPVEDLLDLGGGLR